MTRLGAGCAYIDCWDVEIFDFIDLKKKNGDDRRRAHELFLAVNVRDFFMERLINDPESTMVLFSPYDVQELRELYGEEFTKRYEQYEKEFKHNPTRFNKYTRQVKVMDVYKYMLQSWVESGTPFWHFIDTTNRKHAHPQLGVIRQSNLCVTGDTRILTKQYGYIEIGFLVESGIGELECWNGKEWSMTTLFKTSENANVLNVKLSNFQEIHATPYHKWYRVKSDYKTLEQVSTKDLRPGDKLCKFDLDIVDHGDRILPHAYTNGIYTAEGNVSGSGSVIRLYGCKIGLEDYMSGYLSSTERQLDNGLHMRVLYFNRNALFNKFFVPSSEFRLEDRLEWLAGLLDGDGTSCYNNGAYSVQLSSINLEFLKEVSLLLQELGINNKISQCRGYSQSYLPKNNGTNEYAWYNTQPLYRILIAGSGCERMLELGVPLRRIKIKQHNYNRSCESYIRVLSVTDENITAPTYCGNEPKEHKLMFNGVLTGNCTEVVQPTDEDHTAICNLGSLNVARYVDEETLKKTIKIAVRALDNAIDLTRYPSKKAEITQQERRSIGLGALGEAEYIATHKMEYGSEEHKEFLEKFYKLMSDTVHETTKELAKEKGSCIVDGVRNAYLMCIAPNSTSGSFAGTTNSTEPVYSEIWVEGNKDNEYYVTAPNITKENRPYYKSAFVIDPIKQIDCTAIRQKYIDMSISNNVHMNNIGLKASDVDAVVKHAWKSGLKTLYYFKTKAVRTITCVGCEN